MFHPRKKNVRKPQPDEASNTPVTLKRRRNQPSTSPNDIIVEEQLDQLITAADSSDQKATVTLELDTDTTHDHRAILERNEKIGKQILAGELERGIYRGMGAYAPVFNRKEGAIAAGKYTGAFGPVRSNQHVRMTMRIDLNPEICKDYKETGYCGFGDTCIFIHDRSDYKSGWQLEKEWEAKQKAKAEKAAERLRKGQERLEKQRRKAAGEQVSSESSSESSSDEENRKFENIPFLCTICKRKWTLESKPIVTQCGHYFCEVCAIQQYRSSPKCFECGEATQGLFNVAHKIIEKVRARVAKREARDAERGVISEDGGDAVDGVGAVDDGGEAVNDGGEYGEAVDGGEAVKCREDSVG